MPPTRTPFVCASCASAIRSRITNPVSASRAFTTTVAPQQAPARDTPRWKQTPPAMKMPYRVRPLPNQPTWTVPDDPNKLDEMYDRFVGQAGEAAKGQTGVESTRGRDLLPEEVKWLAITHKSFDHGRRGFNDRLAFLGKRIVDLQTSLALLHAPPTPGLIDPNDRTIYHHAVLEGVDSMTAYNKAQVLSPGRLAQLARSYGLDAVVRWKPKKSNNLQGSGVDTVLAHTLYSIIGALAMQRGGEVATRTTRERILQPLGLR
ncbi:hypothetical protein LTR53_004144 [Teratosphaeriaceae sp. CCFEE 6253]|nr:hypothetical protein LTR53_004144 [Teratosphaeriaceae sp. CCFEE 6253]